MQHIKNHLISEQLKNKTDDKKIYSKLQIIGPSLSILKPETTAIFSIFNRIIGIILIGILTCFPFILSILLNYTQFLSFFYYNISLILIFFILFHILYGRLKLTLYYNKVYIFINRNITTINNLLYIYTIIIIILIVCNLFLFLIIFLIQQNLNFMIFNYNFDFLFLILFIFIVYIKYKILNSYINLIQKINQYIIYIKKRIEIIRNDLNIFYYELSNEFEETYGCKLRF